MNTRAFVWISVLAVLPFAAGPSHAQSDGQATFGSQWWWQSTREAKFQEYTVVPRGGFLESFVLREQRRDLAGALWGRSALRDDENVGLSLSKGVRWRLDGRFQSIPHLFSLVARSPYTETQPGVFRLADSLQRVNQEYPSTLIANMRSLVATAPGIPLASQTELSQVRLRSRPAKGWKLELRGSERQREGHQAYGATFGVGHAVELGIPISQRTRDVDAIASYERGGLRVQATGGVSDFTNNVRTLIWDNPRRYTDGGTNATGSSQGRMAISPDSRSLRGQLSLGAKLPRASVLTANWSVAEGTQNDPFIPYTINTALPQSRIDSLPARSLDAKAETFTQDYRLSGSPISNTWAAVRFRQEQYTNKTEQLTFHGLSPTDYTFSSDTTEQELLSWARTTMGGDLDLNPARWVGVSLLAERRERRHNDREILSDHENVLGGSLRLRPVDGLDVSGSYRHGERKNDGFDAAHYEGEDPAGLRRFDVANRRQDQSQVQAGYGLGERIDLDGTYSYTKNDFNETQFGLLDSKDQLGMLEATWHVSPRFDVDGGWGGNVADSHQHGFDSNSKDWFALLHDRTSFVFTRGTWWVLPNKVSVVGDYTYTWNLVSYELTGRDKFSAADTTLGNRTGTVADDPPDTFYRLQQLSLEGSWHSKGNLDIAVRYAFAQYDVIDFSVAGLPLLGLTTARTGTTYTTTQTALFLGDELQSYRAHRFAVLLTRRF